MALADVVDPTAIGQHKIDDPFRPVDLVPTTVAHHTKIEVDLAGARLAAAEAAVEVVGEVDAKIPPDGVADMVETEMGRRTGPKNTLVMKVQYSRWA